MAVEAALADKVAVAVVTVDPVIFLTVADFETAGTPENVSKCCKKMLLKMVSKINIPVTAERVSALFAVPFAALRTVVALVEERRQLRNHREVLAVM